jgi:hypothetical protein
MSLAAIVATAVLALLISFVAMVVWATLRQINGEARRAADEREA